MSDWKDGYGVVGHRGATYHRVRQLYGDQALGAWRRLLKFQIKLAEEDCWLDLLCHDTLVCRHAILVLVTTRVPYRYDCRSWCVDWLLFLFWVEFWVVERFFF